MGKIKKLVGTVGVAAAAAYLSKEENWNEVKSQLDKTLNKANISLKSPYINNLGKPSEVWDANMVSEGALTSIQYYNSLTVDTVLNPLYIDKLGESSDIRDANMVSEGALTSVQYYNDFKADFE